MDRLNFWVPGLPKAQPRARAARIGNSARMYTPKVADAWKASVAVEFQRTGAQLIPDGPLEVVMTCHLPRPKAHYRTGKHAGELKASAPAYSSSKPDFDNIGKAICDALTGLAWRDDAQIAIGTVIKRYAGIGGAGCLISIRRLPSALE